MLLLAQLYQMIKNGATTLGMTTLSMTTLSITTFSIEGLFAPLSMNDPHHNNTLP
jgi:hypothetical protein